MAFLQARLQEDALLPPEFKDLVQKELKDFQTHPWVEDKINEYLKMAMENPESIHNPEWSQLVEKVRGGS